MQEVQPLHLFEFKKEDLMDKKQLEQRTKEFALRIIKLVSELPKGKIGDVLGYQILKSATSIGAN